MILDANGKPMRSDPKSFKRNYHGAAINRLTNDWVPAVTTGDTALRDGLETMRSRSRQLSQDNDLVKRFLGALENNVIGSNGFMLKMRSRFRMSGKLRAGDNLQIQTIFRKWGHRQFCSYSEELHWIDVQNIVLRSVARDGAIFIRKHKGGGVNQFGYALELIEADMLDMSFIDQLSNGNTVFMGIEKDRRKRVVAYWFLGRHPGDMMFPRDTADYRIRVEAKEIIHYYVKERATQSIGIPWTAASMTRLHFLDRYSEAELRAAERGAEKGGWFQSETGQKMSGPEQVVVDENGNQTKHTVMDFEPESFDELPPGMTFHEYSPNHPVDAFPEFV